LQNIVQTQTQIAQQIQQINQLCNQVSQQVQTWGVTQAFNQPQFYPQHQQAFPQQ
jgi:hypothetical protein